jgi:hypothetical protein
MYSNVKQLLTMSAITILLIACSKQTEQTGQLPLPPDEIPGNIIVDSSDDVTINGADAGKRAVIISKSGMIDAWVRKFRELLGPISLNESQPLGRREVSWDDVVLFLTNNNGFPGNYFNRTDAGSPYNRRTGIELTTPGTGFRVSNNQFGDIDSLYRDEFIPYSPLKNITAVGSNIVDIHFKSPGSDKPGYVHGFGVVFSDVNIAGSTMVSLYSGKFFLGNFPVKIADTGEFSFFGIYLPQVKITRARIKLGEAPLGNGVKDVCDSPTGKDLVVMDDLIFSNPRRL